MWSVFPVWRARFKSFQTRHPILRNVQGIIIIERSLGMMNEITVRTKAWPTHQMKALQVEGKVRDQYPIFW